MAPARMSWYVGRVFGAFWSTRTGLDPADGTSPNPAPAAGAGCGGEAEPGPFAVTHDADGQLTATIDEPPETKDFPVKQDVDDEDMSWTEERVTQLKDMWDRGEPASVIAKTLDVSRNAVIGKAHRLGLAARPSPIRRGGDGDGASKDSAPVVTILDLTERTCRWPIGDPLKPGFRFCGAPVNPGVSYCAEHAALAFQQSGPRREERNQAQAAAAAASAQAAAEAASPAGAKDEAVDPQDAADDVNANDDDTLPDTDELADTDPPPAHPQTED